MSDIDTIQRLCGQLDRGEIDNTRFLEGFTRELARLIGCSRAGVWVFVDTAAGRTLHCVAMHDAASDRMVSVTDMVLDELGPYFTALMRDQCVLAADARTDPATIGFLDDYLLPLDVRSLMDLCFSVNGRLFGVFSCEQVGTTMAWSLRQLQTLRQVGSRASLALMRAAATPIDTTPGALFHPPEPRPLGFPPRRESDDKG